jgi:hypothetical protein
MCENPAELHILRHALEEAGIECVIENEDLAPLMGEVPVSPSSLPSLHVVNDADFERAQEILEDVRRRKKTKVLGDETVRCPLCNATDFRTYRIAGALIVVLVGFLLFLGLAIPFLFAEWSTALFVCVIVSLFVIAVTAFLIRLELLSDKLRFVCDECGFKWNVTGRPDAPAAESGAHSAEEPEEVPEEEAPELQVLSRKTGPEALKDAELLYHRSTSGGAIMAVFGLLFFLGFTVAAILMEETSVGSNLDFGGMKVTAQRFIGVLALFFLLLIMAVFPLAFSLHFDRKNNGLISIHRRILFRKLLFTPLGGAQSLLLRARISVLRKTWSAELVYDSGATVHLFTLPPDEPEERSRVEALAKALDLPLQTRDLG